MGSIFKRGKLSSAEALIIILFIVSLPFVSSKIDWDGTGYYGYLRSALFDHNLQFKSDWTANTAPLAAAPGKAGLPHGIPITKTGHLANYLAVGPAILWAPFVGATHAGVLLLRHGQDIPGDGHGAPYRRAVCLASALYAFLGLWISFRLAREFVEEKWALLATIAIWFASSLTLYMYADPSWAHADCVFVVALFLWYWYRTREHGSGVFQREETEQKSADMVALAELEQRDAASPALSENLPPLRAALHGSQTGAPAGHSMLCPYDALERSAKSGRTAAQWAIWGLIAGLMCDVYFPNSVFVLLPALELVLDLRKRLGSPDVTREPGRGLRETLPPYSPQRASAPGAPRHRAALHESGKTLLSGTIFAVAFIVAFSPTLIVRQIIFGNPISTGAYGSQRWNWTHPKFLSILFASSHGLFTTTPILLIAVAGLFLFWRSHPAVGGRLLLLAAAFWCLIAVYPWWNGLVSFGNRFFVSLTPIFVVGLAAAFQKFTAVWHDSRAAMRRATVVAALLIVWNMGLVFQLDHGLFMQVGPVDWQNAVYLQFREVPGMVAQEITAKFSPHNDLHEQARSN